MHYNMSSGGKRGAFGRAVTAVKNRENELQWMRHILFTSPNLIMRAGKD